MAESLKNLITYGESLGYKNDDLREFVKTQQEIEREERHAERERIKAEAEDRRTKEKYENEMKLQQMNHQYQMEILHEKGKLKLSGKEEVSAVPLFKGSKIPAFDDEKTRWIAT